MEILREQYLDYMSGGPVERPLFVELFGPLIGLDEEWRDQGADPAELDLTGFGFDHVRRHRVGINLGLLHPAPNVLLEETAEHRIHLDGYGRRMMLCRKSATIPLPLDYPVKDMDSWQRFKPQYAFAESRWGEGWLEAARQARAEGALLVAGIPGGFDQPRQLMGEEALCLAYYEEPELVHDMLETIGGMAERVLDRVTREVEIDQISVHEDMAGKSGSLVGPTQITEFIAPYYRRLWDLAQSRGARLFSQDSDGNLNAVLPALLEAGLNCSYPMEPAAGMDIVAVRKAYGSRLAVLGGIDKHVLRQDRAAIRRELEYKLQPCMRQGGVVFGLDHRIPNGTPLENYRYYVTTAREILGLEPQPPPGWARMAF